MQSGLFKLGWTDLGKGLVTAFLGVVIMGIIGIISSGWPTGPQLLELLRMGLVAVLGYLAKNILTNSDNKFLTSEPPK